MDQVLAISMLQLLYMIYTEQRRRAENTAPNPERMQELIDELEIDGAQMSSDALNRKIEAKFDIVEATQVKGDLALFGLVAEPVGFDQFDYWGLLNRLLRSLQQVAIRHNIFKIRGRKGHAGLILKLGRTTDALISDQRLRSAIRPLGHERLDHIEEVAVFLSDQGEQFPLVVVVTASFQNPGAGIGGYSQSSFFSNFAIYKINVGQQAHWLKFILYQSVTRFTEFEFMLSGPELRWIVQALSEDFRAYVDEIRRDVLITGSLFHEVDGFINRLNEE